LELEFPSDEAILVKKDAVCIYYKSFSEDIKGEIQCLVCEMWVHIYSGVEKDEYICDLCKCFFF